MKIVTWNCNGALRNKFKVLTALDADIYVVQECEDPKKTNHEEYKNWAGNYIWKGDNKNKGVGIFCSQNYSITENEWKANGAKHFISATVNCDFILVAVWNHHANSPNFKYIGQFWKYLQINKHLMQKAIIVGDFNSNKIWDEWDRWWNHSDVVRELGEIGIVSIYHEYFKERQGEETQSTFFLQRNPAKRYHIDYAFADKTHFTDIKNFVVGCSDKWLQHSDHMPIVVEC